MAARRELSTFDTALGAFKVDVGSYPTRLGYLVEKPLLATNWHGPYFDKDSVPLDPWGHAYIYKYPGRHNPQGYDLSSMGPDGRAGNDDDINNWL